MPKKINTKKSASAQFASIKAIQRAAAGESTVLFASVQGAKGNGYFRVRTADGVDLTGTPQGKFTSGTMRIAAGQIVVLEGVPADIKTGLARARTIPYEIVGVVQERHVAEQLVKRGELAREVLRDANSAGTFDAAPAEELDDLFEAAEAAPEADAVADVRGGVRDQRKAADARRAVAARVELLLGLAPLRAAYGGEAAAPKAEDDEVNVDDL
jgi:translation initiation factor IF-1